MSATETDCGAHEEPSLESLESLEGERQRRRRPATIHRTGRRGKHLHAQFGTNTRTLVESPSELSTRHTRVRQETSGNPITVLNRLLNTLQESGIPGPQLFRLDKEFSHQLGQGGQGNVRGLDANVAQQYRRANKRIHKIWPVEHIAIKQHLERKDGRAHKAHFDRANLLSRFRAAECEVLALAPGLFHNHPNIVKLIGWGLCLDTVEDPSSPCCGGIQLPLLVFERADMNFAQFLDGIFAETTPGRSDEARLEEGLAVSRPIRQSWSLTGRAWRSVLRRRARREDDAYEAVRRLCIDIGYGLQSLHENKFTHGDLKPENVLVFQTAGGLTAKLCDFGCAVGQDDNESGTLSDMEGDTDAAPKQRRERHRSTYLGTPGWIPSDRDLESIRGFDGLRRCDLYVYGLLVWSSFCLGGRPYSRRPRLQDMLVDVMELASSRRNSSVSSTTFDRQIGTPLTNLLKDTMREPEERSLTPWTLLERERAGKGHQKSTSATDAYSQGSENFEGHLSLEMKENYNKRAWWSRPGGQNQDDTLTQAGDQSESVAIDADNDDNNEPGPASWTALSSDNNCLSTALFETQMHSDDITKLPGRMKSTIEKLSTANRSQDGYEELYHLARFRSRIKLKWWNFNPKTVKEDNILRMALQAVNPFDVHTLAWLCVGPIGRTEVKTLTAHPSIWESILRPDFLNESERLDRFLLLLQFGAPVHKVAPTGQQRGRFLGGHRAFEIQEEDRGTIFAQFIKSCRPAIVDTVVTQVFRRLARAREDGFIPDSTFGYFFLQRHGRLWPSEAFLDLGVDHVDAALSGFKAGLNDAAIKGSAPEEGAEEVVVAEGGTSQLAMEATPLLRSKVLPHGWNAIDSALAQDASLTCYEDGFTHSVTLTKPKVSPLQMRQLTVGFLQRHSNDGLSCHVDLLACMRAGSGPRELSEFAHNVERRFPYYDDAWFAAEWNTEPNVVDVLRTLKGPWRIQTFTSLLNAPETEAWRRAATSVVGIGFVGTFSACLAFAMIYPATLLNIEHSIFMSYYAGLIILVAGSLVGLASSCCR